jgi:hypothetical protein
LPSNANTDPGPKILLRLHVDQVVGAREEHLPRQRGIGDDDAAAEERHIDGEDGSVSIERVLQKPAAKGRHQDHLHQLRQAHDRRHLARGCRGLRIDGHCRVSHERITPSRFPGTSVYRRYL